VPEVAALLTGRVFLSPRTMDYDAALLALLATVTTRRPALLLGTLPWLRRALPVARFRTGRPLPMRLAQEAVADTVGLASLLEGSVRHRRVVL
jgi:hypothetical protein